MCVANDSPDGTSCSDDGNQCTDDICGFAVCTHPARPTGTLCGSANEDDCDHQDTCDGAGICQPNYEQEGTACGDDTPNGECDDADICDATGVCLPNSKPAGTTCGSSNDDDCDNPDTCDGLGVCLDNFESEGTSCTSDGFLCTDDLCDGLGSCTYPSAAGGTPCESDGDPCTDDECDAFGACTHPNADNETPCTSDGNDCTWDICDSGICAHYPFFSGGPCDDGDACTIIDLCDGGGLCVGTQNADDGTPCDDGEECTDPDACASGVCVGTQDCPFVVHGAEGVSFENHAFGGYIDPRAESDNGVDLNLGLDQVTVVFSEQVRDLGGGSLTAAAFSVAETGSGGGPQRVRSISTTDDVTVTVHLDRIITLWEWTTIVAAVEDLAGNPIESFGDMGAKANEPDRMDFGFLPADVNQDGNINPLDLLRFKQIINGDPPTSGIDVDFLDINRNGSVNPLDLIAFKQLINGISPPATQSWTGESMKNSRP